MIILTDDERALLHECYGHIGQILANPKAGVSYLASSRASGCGGGFEYQVDGKSLTGSWKREHVVETLPDGSPRRLRFDEPHRRAEIALTRIQRWAASLPAELRARALTAWSTWPVNTRNLSDLDDIVHEAIDLSAPAEQLDMFPELVTT